MPDFSIEAEYGFFENQTIIGVDEVGRGCLAGSVVAAAVSLDFRKIIELGFDANGFRPKSLSSNSIFQIKDSKLIPESKRSGLAEWVKGFVTAYAIGEASVEEIDELNILVASHLAMERAVSLLEASLQKKAKTVLVDGNLLPKGLKSRGVPVIKGDNRSISIACASVIAKVFRDEQIQALDLKYPGYGLAKHKGYSTKFHKEQIQLLGATEIHRKSFKGVKA